MASDLPQPIAFPGAESSAGESSSGQGPGVKLFLGGLSWETTEDKVRDHFGQYGEVKEVIVMKDRVTGKPRGFGFVTFEDEGVADRVVNEVHVLNGRQIDAKRSVPQDQKPKSKKIFVGGLAPDTTEEQFREHFEQFGKIGESQIMQDHNSGRSRGFGFITFEEEGAVERVFASGTMHELAGKRVEVKTATPKGAGSTLGRGRGITAVRGLMPGRGGPAGYGVATTYGAQLPGQLGSTSQYAIPGYSAYGSAGVIGSYPAYGGPYGAYSGMMLGQLGGAYGYGPYASYGAGYPAGQAAAPGAAAFEQPGGQQGGGGGGQPSGGTQPPMGGSRTHRPPTH